jgi:cellobiose-specific phosphotransferase system component IIA
MKLNYGVNFLSGDHMKLSEFLKLLEKAKEHVKKKDPEIMIYHDSSNRYIINTMMEQTERNKKQYIFIHGGDKLDTSTPIDRSKIAPATRKEFTKKVYSGYYESGIIVPKLQPMVRQATISLDDSEESIIEKVKEAFKNYQQLNKDNQLENHLKLVKARDEDQLRLKTLFFKDLMLVYFPDIKEDSDAYRLIVGSHQLDDKIRLVDFFERLLKEVKND